MDHINNGIWVMLVRDKGWAERILGRAKMLTFLYGREDLNYQHLE